MLKPTDIDAYIAGFPKEVLERMAQLRATIKKVAPQAEEVISYGMPAFKLKGMLVWFAAYAHHIGFYPTASGITAFKKELSIYKGGKGSVQFPFDKPLPLGLVAKIVQFKVAENLQKAAMKKKA